MRVGGLDRSLGLAWRLVASHQGTVVRSQLRGAGEIRETRRSYGTCALPFAPAPPVGARPDVDRATRQGLTPRGIAPGAEDFHI